MNKKRRWDILLIAGFLLLSCILYLLYRPGGEGAWVVVTSNGQEIARCSLSEDRIITFGDEDYNVLQIAGGAASITEANCGDHTCVRTGEISREGESIVCLPHRLIVRIEGGRKSDFDADVG